MTDASLSTRMELVKYYRSKKTHRLCISKTPIALIEEECEYCREALCRNIFDEMCVHRYNKKQTNSEHYHLVPKPIIQLNGKPYAPSCRLTMKIGDTDNRLIWDRISSDDSKLDKVLTLLDYTLGIINVCMTHSEEERQRIKLLMKSTDTPSRWYREQSDFQQKIVWEYDRISPWWIVSIPTTSLIFLLFRGALSQVDRHPRITDSLLNSISHKEICDIINTMDYSRAMKVYRKYLIPYYERCDNAEETDNIFHNEKDRELIEKYLMNGNFNKLFPPTNIHLYWGDDSPVYNEGCYGIASFLGDIQKGRSLGGEECEWCENDDCDGCDAARDNGKVLDYLRGLKVNV